ncbi:alpha/beta fold hydrolase [Shimia sp. SDUM112013]|uniref:YheT family hydrolase n=1 Tax=Shimia sp. SDUM112013 TaxID=3136160 RepID=UPI0032EF93CB
MTQTDDLHYIPPRHLRPAFVQTMLAGMSLRKRGRGAMDEAAKPLVLDCGDGVRTTGMLSENPKGRGTVLVLHGWLGHVESTYVVSTSRYLFDQGFSILRINLLDHGDTLNLNPKAYHAAHFDEVFNAIAHATGLAPHGPVSLLGFSLGGNFALRVARHLKRDPLPDMARVFAISPVVHPAVVGEKIDAAPLIRRYFRRKLHRTFRSKQSAFPDLYDMTPLIAQPTITGATEAFMQRYGDYPDAITYFNSYALGVEDLKGCPVPVMAIGSLDDPIVPGADLGALAKDPNLEIILTRHGGHNGFFQSLRGPTFYDELILRRLSA